MKDIYPNLKTMRGGGTTLQIESIDSIHIKRLWINKRLKA